MKKDELWEAYRFVNPMIGDTYQAWPFGVEADALANLVVSGQKCATSSLYVAYEREKERLPQVSDYNIILNGRGDAVCIVETIKVSIVPFNEVTEEHAFKEGEGDRCRKTWRAIHRDFFSKELEEFGLHFHEGVLVVCEEFRVVYKA